MSILFESDGECSHTVFAGAYKLKDNVRLCPAWRMCECPMYQSVKILIANQQKTFESAQLHHKSEWNQQEN